MKIEPIGAPSITQPTGAKSVAQVSARERAIAMVQAQSTPVQNPTNVAPEELSAIRAPSRPAEMGQVDKNESPAPEVAAETKTSSEPLSSQYAILARKEKALRLRDQQLKQERAAFEASRSKPADPSTPTIDESKFISKDSILKNPIQALLDMGLTYDQLTEAAINGPSQENLTLQNELRSLKDEIKALKGETESTKKSFEENQNLQRTQAERQIKADVSRLVSSDPSFETIRETRSVNDVVELITKTFDEDGILLTVEEAAQQVEDYLLDEALKLARLKKVQSRLAPKAVAPSAPTKTDGQPQNQLRTLTSQVSGSRPLSARERAILAAEGKLNK